ncbi:MAG: hypothetical protein R3D29_03525 [Nitratireductor sp.]
MTIVQHLRQNFFSRPDLTALPARIRLSISQREWANEVLLRVIQLVVIVMFCVIYAASPATRPQGSFSPVPYVLGGPICCFR